MTHHIRSRHWLGILCTMGAVFAWTTSAFLMSTMFADNSYPKPFLVSYLTAGFASLLLIPVGWTYRARTRPSVSTDIQNNAALEPSVITTETFGMPISSLSRTALILCLTWTLANWLNAWSLSFTSVASSTIMTSTCSFHVLLFGALFGIEAVTKRKLAGVIISILGIAAISTLDLLGASDTSRGDFPSKSNGELVLGDVMAFTSAVVSAGNTILIKRNIPDAGPGNMAVFFGLVGLFTIVTLWPAFPVLSLSGLETFQVPTSPRIWVYLISNSFVCLAGNYAWAYAVVLTSPTVVTVGLTLSIPLSLVGQSVLNAQFAGIWYWLGAAVVVCGFLLVEGEASETSSASLLQVEPRASQQSDEETPFVPTVA